MSKYKILYSNYDFNMVTENYFYQSKGSRIKTLVIDKNGKKAMFKYEKDPTNNCEAVAEKLGLEFIDTYNGTKDIIESKEGLASDMLHANDAGYRALAEYISQNISLDIFY